jgi:tetratricopeptide (TPR) repeat protein
MDFNQIKLIDHWLSTNNLQAAKSLLISLIQNEPNNIDAIQRIALFWPQEAIQLIDDLLPEANRSVQIHLIQGNLNLEYGNPTVAVSCYQAILSSTKNPSFEVLHNLGLAYAKLLLHTDAVQQFGLANDINPDSYELHTNWGASLKNLGLFKESLAHLSKAAEIEPKDSNIWLNRGVTLDALNLPEQAIESYDTALQINPNFLEAFTNKANSLLVVGQIQEAISNYQKALGLNPQDSDSLYNLSLAQLSLGDFEEGWKNYENRWHRENAPTKPYEHIDPLKNLKNIEGKRILVWSEQGLGDSIQFCRFISPLIEMGAHVSLATQPELVEILGTISGLHQIASPNVLNDGKFDYQIPLLSLPLLFQSSKKEFPSVFPYLRSNPIKAEQWHTRLGQEKRYKVGLVWSGGYRPDMPELWAVNERRNIPLSTIAKLKNIPGILFVSLQKGNPAEAELAQSKKILWPNDNLFIAAPELRSFEDTAALIENLDLVISVDTSTAHLAGALGKPLWILNRYDSCWRWLHQQKTTHWYPNARIFNQPNPRNWNSVMADVTTELSSLVAKQSK